MSLDKKGSREEPTMEKNGELPEEEEIRRIGQLNPAASCGENRLADK